MKKINLFLFVALGLVAVSCSGTSEETVETSKYTLDKKASSLEWAASMSPEYGHKGTVEITEGSIEMEGDVLKSGAFTIDMNTIKSTDLEEPKASILAGHLKGTETDENHPAD